MTKIKGCENFLPFDPIDSDLCITCEKHRSLHFTIDTNPMLPYKQAIVTYLLEDGGLKSYYGSVYKPQPPQGSWPGNEAWKQKTHFETCGINWEKTPLPEMRTVDEFAGTFDEANKITVIHCEITCNCGEYEADDNQWGYVSSDDFWTLEDQDMTISNIILKVVKAGQVGTS